MILFNLTSKRGGNQFIVGNNYLFSGADHFAVRFNEVVSEDGQFSSIMLVVRWLIYRK